jgi:glycosyltransferase involved in cell wall biosynthesis
MDRRSNSVVSIIVPARNEEACLSSCLESLVAQTGIHFEIIVIDDASTDRTAEIARSFAINEGSDAPGKGTTSSRAENHGNTIDGTAVSRALPKPEAPHGEDPSASLRAGARSSTRHVGADALVRPDIYVISAPPLPEGWTGKNHAMTVGAKLARGKWLLFTDADTVHKPGSLVRAVAEAEQHGAVLLSYSPEQEVRRFWEKAVMPVIFAELAATYPPAKVNDPASPVAAANGQYLLVSREAYDAVGGHTAIAGDLLEDVAMARLVKSSGRKIFFRYGGDAVRTRMYRSWAQMKEGWTKNLALLFPRPRTLSFLRAAEFALIVGNLFVALLAWWSGHPNIAFATVLLGLLVVGSCLTRIRRAHFSASSNLLSPLGLAIFSYLLFRSEKLHREGRVSWKGRRYGMGSENPEHPRQENPTTRGLGLSQNKPSEYLARI